MLLTTTTTFHVWRHQLNARKSRISLKRQMGSMFPRSICSFLNWEKTLSWSSPSSSPSGSPSLSGLDCNHGLSDASFLGVAYSAGPSSCFKTLGFATRHLWPRANASFSYCPVANTQYPTYFAKVRLLVFVFSAFETPKVQWSQTCPFICYLVASTWGPPLGRSKHPYLYIEFLFVIFESFIYVWFLCSVRCILKNVSCSTFGRGHLIKLLFSFRRDSALRLKLHRVNCSF
jgi:hypothetical protein